jgi:hypothetical protein
MLEAKKTRMKKRNRKNKVEMLLLEEEISEDQMQKKT